MCGRQVATQLENRNGPFAVSRPRQQGKQKCNYNSKSLENCFRTQSLAQWAGTVGDASYILKFREKNFLQLIFDSDTSFTANPTEQSFKYYKVSIDSAHILFLHQQTETLLNQIQFGDFIEIHHFKISRKNILFNGNLQHHIMDIIYKHLSEITA